MKGKRVRRAGLLRFLAVLFALGIIAGSLCFGAKTYFDRSVDAMVEENIAGNGVLANHEVFREMDGQEIRDYAKDFIPIAVKQDKAGMEKLIKRVMDIYIRSASPLVRYLTRDEARYREFVDRTFAKAFSGGEFSDGLKELIEKTKTKLGIRWYLVEIVVYSRELMTAAFALAGISLLLWLVLGGISGGIVRTGLLPALIIAAICGGLILLLSTRMEPARFASADLEKFITTYI